MTVYWLEAYKWDNEVRPRDPDTYGVASHAVFRTFDDADTFAADREEILEDECRRAQLDVKSGSPPRWALNLQRVFPGYQEQPVNFVDWEAS